MIWPTQNKICFQQFQIVTILQQNVSNGSIGVCGNGGGDVGGDSGGSHGGGSGGDVSGGGDVVVMVLSLAIMGQIWLL